jgi:uncharacterized protein (DUF2345 family)
MLDSKTLMRIINTQLDVGKAILSKDSITMGVVVDGDDPLQSGRLRVFCPNLNDDPKKLHHIPWAVCASPFAGTISNKEFSRGAGKGKEKTPGAVSYGFWGIPEQGAIVLVARVDGDERRRVWLGCVQSHQEMHTLFHGRYEWKNGGPDGPLSSTKDPINPAYENAQKAFEGFMDSAEWKTRQAEYQATSNPISQKEIADGLKSYLDQEYSDISKEEKDEWVKEILGSHGYDWSSNKALGEFLQSKVYGFSTPGFHAFSMDDRAYNNRIRIRSATGHQLIFDDTNERIYLSTNEGNNWVEFDSNGNIDIYSKKRISVRAEDDINFSTDKSFRVKAKEGIYMYSGDTREQEKLDEEKPEIGEIRFHSTADTHLFSEKNYKMLVKEDWLAEVGGKHCLSIAETMSVQVEEGIDTIVNNGDYQLAVNGNYHHHAAVDTSIFSGNDNKIQAVNDTEIFSYTGKMDIGSMANMTVKSYEGDMTLEAIENNMKMMSNKGQNQITMRNPFLNIFSIGQIITQSAVEVGTQVSSTFSVDSDKDPTINGSKINSQCLSIDNAVNVKFSETEIELEAVSDIKHKVSAFDTSITTINDSLEQLETKVNNLSYTTANYINDLIGSWGGGLSLSFPFPGIPSIPSPSIIFPAIDLPELDFDFCINLGDIIKVDEFNPQPDAAFLKINVDLGGWTARNFKDWFERQKVNFEGSLQYFENGLATGANSIGNAMDSIKNSISNVSGALDNLVNISVTDNGLSVDNYTLGIGDFTDALADYNNAVKQYNDANGTSLETLDDLQNQSNDHRRTIETINEQIQKDPSSVDGYDFSDLSEMKDFFAQYSTDLNGLG